MIGRIVQVLKGDVKIHTYIAPPASFLVTSHIIETPNQMVVVDTQFLQTAARDVLAYAESLGKPIERVILSHAHPDHWSGGNIFDGVPLVSTQAIADAVQADIDGGGVTQRAGLVGEAEVPAVPRVPEAGIEAGALTIDGVNFEFQVYDNAEAPQQIVVALPDHGVVIAQDLLYTNAHFFPGLDRANWISILQGWQAAGGFDTLLSGHGMPTSPGELTNAIQYLTLANELVANATSADDVVVGLTEAFPGYEVDGILQFWGLFIQSS
jgi:glyoxylase-like metal-dependent hydrolase (beta-lactamase superfamily II)